MNADGIVRALMRCCVETCDGCAFRPENFPKCEQRMHKSAAKLIESLQAKNQQLRQWVNDLQSGMYVNCVYCGHRYGPEDKVPASMADALKAHIEQCPEHPMSHLKAQLSASQRRERAAGCDGCAECGKWENEIEYGYPSPCTRCKRRCTDNWRGLQVAGEGDAE